MNPEPSRRGFLSVAGKGLGFASLSIPTIGALVKEVEAASRSVAHLTPQQAAIDEDYWSVIQNAFTVTRGIINLNNGGASPRPRNVSAPPARYLSQHVDSTAVTLTPIL